MEVVGAGDAILARHISRSAAEELAPVRDLIGSADAAYVNFEMVTPDLPATPSATPIALRVAAPAWTLDELAWLGFDLFGIANNHADDYGYAGLVRTVEQMEHRDLVFAGAGRSLEAARMPAYLDTPAGRVALLCATSSGATQSLAADGQGIIASRPGTNPLRFSTEYRLAGELFEQLRRIDDSLGSAEMTRRLLALGVFPGFDGRDPDQYRFAGRRFVRSTESGIVTAPDPRDVDGIRRWVDEARRSADVVVVGLHCHEGQAEGWNVEEPADFIATAAHAFVDAGADIVFGHGPHRLRGVEIYQGRPICYSLGNFLFLDETISIVDPEQYALFGLDPRSTPADLHDWREQWPDGTVRGFHSQQAYWDSVIAKCRFDDGRCTRVELHPVELGRVRPRLSRGVPEPATGDAATRILGDVARMSRERYGTTIDVTGGIGVVAPADPVAGNGHRPIQQHAH
jgi:poly-gamma-glutamate synthesis protein (capsule biosynthesis protein)